MKFVLIDRAFYTFVIVGIVSNFAGYISFVLLGPIGGYPDNISIAVCFIVALLIKYVLNKIFTFTHQSNWLKSIVRMGVVYITGYFIDLQLVTLLRTQFGIGHATSQFIVMVLLSIAFYLLSKYYIFAKGDKSYAGVTPYRWPTSAYFNSLLNTIVKFCNNVSISARILDYGCGHGHLSKRFERTRVVNFDIVKELTDIDDWRLATFDIFVANQVFYTFTRSELEYLLLEIKKINPNATLIVGISKQSWLNKLGMYLFGMRNAHDNTKLKPNQEFDILNKYCFVADSKNVFMLTDIYVLNFKK